MRILRNRVAIPGSGLFHVGSQTNRKELIRNGKATNKIENPNRGLFTGHAGLEPPGAELPPMPPSDGGLETTGRYVVAFKAHATDKSVRSLLSEVSGLKSIAMSADCDDGAVAPEDMTKVDASYLRHLRVSLITSEDAMQALAVSTADAGSPVLAIVPEYYLYLSSEAPLSTLAPDYLRGYRDGVNLLATIGTRTAVEMGWVRRAAGQRRRGVSGWCPASKSANGGILGPQQPVDRGRWQGKYFRPRDGRLFKCARWQA